MKQEYIAPKLTVVTFKVERGFDASAFSTLFVCGLLTSETDENLNQAASYEESTWTW